MKGYFSEETLDNYARLAAEKLDLDFAEGGLYDFTRCVRPDGSAYGTGGKCRKGTEGEKEAPAKTNIDKVVDKVKEKYGSDDAFMVSIADDSLAEALSGAGNWEWKDTIENDPELLSLLSKKDRKKQEETLGENRILTQIADKWGDFFYDTYRTNIPRETKEEIKFGGQQLKRLVKNGYFEKDELIDLLDSEYRDDSKYAAFLRKSK